MGVELSAEDAETMVAASVELRASSQLVMTESLRFLGYLLTEIGKGRRVFTGTPDGEELREVVVPLDR